MRDERAVVLLLSGPNLNLLGEREPEVYGTATLDDHVATARAEAERHGLELEHLQSNHEGELVEAIHGARGRCAAIVINPGAFTHYAWSIHDALAAFDGPIVELHLSNPNAREPWRHTSVVAPVAAGLDHRLRRRRLPPRARRRRVPARPEDLMTAALDHLLDQLPAMDVAGRVDRLRAAFDDAGCDALLVTKLVNIRYLTGFTGSAALLLVRPDELRVRHRRPLRRAGRRRSSARPGVDGPHRDLRAPSSSRSSRRPPTGVDRLGLEADRSPGPRSAATPPTGSRRPSSCPPRALVDGLRLVKDAGEVARIEAAAAHRRRGAVARCRPRLAERPTEDEFGLELDTEIRRLGAVGHQLRDDRGVRAERREAPPPARLAGRSPRATSSCSTSARWSTATART